MKLRNEFEIIEEARENLLNLSNYIYNRAMKEFKMDFDVLFVIYVGIWLAAGWATKYEDLLTVLFDLEKICELKWFKKRKN